MSDLRDFIQMAGARQVELFDYPTQPMTPQQRAEYWRTHVLAALDELHEILDCLDWKPWSDTQGEWQVDKETLTSEIMDLLAFLGNLCFMAGISHGQLEPALDRNDTKIRERVARGYAARARTRVPLPPPPPNGRPYSGDNGGCR